MKVFVVLIGSLTLIPFLAAKSWEDLSEEVESTEDSEEIFLERRQRCPTITFPCSRMPKVCANMRAAITAGKPRRLTRITNKSQIRKNRVASGCTRMKPKPPGFNCDEYPFASSKQGGKGAVIKLVPKRENDRQGGLLRAFYTKKNIGNGDCFNVKLGT